MSPAAAALDDETAAGRRLAQAPPGEEVCITGLAGLFPESNNVYEFQENLMNKVDMVIENHGRWDMVHVELPTRMGRVYGESKMDAGFFGLHEVQADLMDPMLRMLLVKTYEAIVDAGVNPTELEGTRTAVIVGACSSEQQTEINYEMNKPSQFSTYGKTRSAFANRISYWFKVNGPSYTVDTACSSSLYAVEHGYRAIRDGHCDQAIVTGANLCIHPAVTLQFNRIGVLSADGMCKSFDNNANGYVRSEAVSAVFLQKAKSARRVYATVIYGKTNCDGYTEQSITYPSGEAQSELLAAFYRECQVDPEQLAWVEAHGTGTGVGDPEELNAINKSLCARRSKPLPIGSVKSNMGHTEPGSGLCSVTKVIISMETGLIPPNLHYKTPKTGVPALLSGKLQVVTEPQAWSGGLVGINSFGFGGANCHVLLKSNPKKKVNGGAAKDKLPRLVNISGRTEQAVNQIFDELTSRPVDTELVRLYQQVHCKEIPAHIYRGFVLLKPGCPTRHVQMYEPTSSSLWLVLSDDVSDITTAARSLLGLPAFAKVIENCQKALTGLGLDLLKVIQEENALKNAVHKSVVTTATQIALVEVLKTVGIKADGIVGHSAGEAAAAFADNSLTLEQAVKTAYHQGLAIQENTNKDLVKNLQKVIPTPKTRSSKWLSSAAGSSTLASAEFFAESASKATSLEASLRYVPRKAILVTISPRKECREIVADVGRKTQNVDLITKEMDGIESLLTALGRLYSLGVNMDPVALYPAVSYPVSVGTRMIAPFIGWDHRKDWDVGYYSEIEECDSCEKLVVVTMKALENLYLKGHVIDGRNLFPATGYLELVWKTFGEMKKNGLIYSTIVMEDLRFNRATNIPKDGSALEFWIYIQKVSGRFELMEGGASVVTGRIFMPVDVAKEMVDLPAPPAPAAEGTMDMSSRDVYKELNLRGYNYSNVFRSIVSADRKGTRGRVRWENNCWVAFIDNLLQMQILAEDTRGLFVPTSIEKVTIDPPTHRNMISDMEASGEDTIFDVVVSHESKVIKSGGVEIRGLKASAIARRKQQTEPVVEKYQFVPDKIDSTRKGHMSLSLREALGVCVHRALENLHDVEIKCFELADDASDSNAKALLAPTVLAILGDLPLIRSAIKVLAKADHPLTQELPPEVVVEDSALETVANCHFVLGSGLTRKPTLLSVALDKVSPAGCIVSREKAGQPLPQLPGMNVICELDVGDEKIVAIKKDTLIVDPLVLRVTDAEFEWVSQLQAALAAQQKSPRRILLVAQGEPTSGVLGLTNCLSKEPGGDRVRCFFIVDSTAPKFDPTLELYKKQIDLDLLVNVFQDGCWGSYRHLLLEDNAPVDAEHAYVNVTSRGDLSSLTWLEGPLKTGRTGLKPREELVQIYFSALNFRDVMTATGKLAAEVVVKGRLNQECVQGLEFAGRDSKGRRVMGMVAAGAMASMVVADADLLWDIPDDWTMEDAATVPVVYGTALYALVIIGRMAKGDTVLIHAGSGGVGQAAITLALHAGCTVFTTVGTQEKRDFIRQRFPQLSERQIGNSRDTSFEQLVLTETKGRGVDLVLNSLAEEKLQASVRCLAVGGRFLEIGKFDLAANNTIGMEVFLRETSFHGIMLDSLFDASPEAKRQLLDIVQRGIVDGAVRPLTRTVFEDDDVEQAFRFMAAGKHIGKVLLQIRPEEPNRRSVVPEIRLKKVAPRFFCNPEQSYVVAGGLGGFGLELADWMVLRGARKLVLTSRQGIRSGYQVARVATWKSYGADVRISTADITTQAGVTALLEQANALGPVGGIFNLAVVLADALFENQTAQSFATSAGPKSVATHWLDVVSRRLCPKLTHFVVFSSVSCGRGNAGQTNYGASNSVMERICERRVADNLPGLAIQWGAVGEVGLVAEMQEENYELVIGGTLQQRISSCLHVMDTLLRQSQPVVASMVVAEKRSGAGETGNVVDSVSHILGIKDLKSVSLTTTLAELGMDSMMAVEIKQMLERDYEVFLPPQEMRNLTFGKLHELNALAAEAKKEQNSAAVTGEGGYEDAMKFMLRAIGNEEIVTKTVTVLPSLSGAATSAPSTTLFMIPGIEGTASVLEPLARNLNAQAVGLQLAHDATGKGKLPESTLEMARSLLPHVQKGLVAGSPFNLLGYSFGSMVALDLAYLLEADGYRGEVFLVDGSPDYLQEICRGKTEAASDENLQANTIIGILSLIKPLTLSAMIQLRQELLMLDSWESRLELLIKLLPENTRDPAFLKAQASGALSRIRAIVHHAWAHPAKVQSRVTLLRQTFPSVAAEEDYGVGKYCEQKVDVHLLEGDHVSILESLQLATVINNQVVNTHLVNGERPR